MAHVENLVAFIHFMLLNMGINNYIDKPDLNMTVLWIQYFDILKTAVADSCALSFRAAFGYGARSGSFNG